MSPIIIIKSGTTAIPGSIVKGSFSYFSASTRDLGPTSTTGLYSGIDAPTDGYTIYQIGGPNGFTIRVATNSTELNAILIGAGATGTTLNDRINWATNTNSIFINSGNTTPSVQKIIVGGNYTTFTGSTQNRLISLNPNGSKDSTFNIGTGFGAGVKTTSIQSDGKIVAGGDFTTFTGSSQNRVIRLNSNGSKDSTFNIGTGFDGDVYLVAIQSDGKILVGGFFATYSGSSQNGLIRLNSDGSKDTTFNIGSGFNSAVLSTATQSDGKILAGGSFTTFTGSSQNSLIRLNSDGSKDTTFNIGSGFDGSGSIYSISIQTDGKIIVGGGFTTFTGSSQNFLIRLNSDGSKDTSFNIGTGFGGGVSNLSWVYSTSIQSDGKIVAGGRFTTFTGSSQNRLIRLNSNGSKDTSFDIGTGFDGDIRSTPIQPDGKILVGGDFSTYNEATQVVLIRLNSDGSKDTSFDIGSSFNSNILSISIST